MRITNNMIFGATTRNANAHLEKLFGLQNQLATGKKITRPSDDPTGTDRAMLLRGTLKQQEQYQENIRDAGTWLKLTDGALDEAYSVMDRARELAVRGANDPNQVAERTAMAEEVKQLREQLQVISNSEINGRFIFGGTKTVDQPNAVPPFSLPYPNPVPPATEITYTGNDVLMDVEVVPGVTLPFNTPGTSAFGDPADADRAFKVLEDLENALRAGDATVISAQIGRLDVAMGRVSTERAVVGSRINRLDLLENRYADAAVSYKERLSETEEPEFADVVSQLMQSEAVYQASLAASSRIIQPSLLDYLR
ncbi:Flagellar hook-associated protein 3 [compost metagenome]